MKITVRSYLLIFLMFLVIITPAIFFLLFRSSVREYMDAVAKYEVTQKLLSARIRLDNSSSFDKTITLPEDVLLYDDRMNLVYPEYSDAEEIEGFPLFSIHDWSNAELSEEKIQIVMDDNEDYMMMFLQIDSQNCFQASYIVSFSKLSNDKTFLLRIEGFILLIIILITTVLLPLLWYFSGYLSKPLRRLRQYSKRLGEGNLQIPRVKSHIWEIEELSLTLSAMAHKLNEHINAHKEFFQNISHDLRAPLMSISGYAQGIQENIFPDSLGATQVIIMECERMKLLLDSILTVAGLDSKIQEVVPERVNLHEFLIQIIHRLNGIVIMCKKDLIFLSEEDQLYVYVDPSLLEKVCVNLFANALQHAKKNIYVELFQQDENICAAIENDGPPLSDEEMSHLFDRFYKGINGSFGIGLSIVKSAVGYMDGSVIAENGIHGARFTLILKNNM